MADLEAGTAIAVPGTHTEEVIPVTNLPGGHNLDIPVIVLHGAVFTPKLRANCSG